MESITQTQSLLVESSLTGQRWVSRAVNERTALAISQRCGVPVWFAELLTGRGVGLDDADDFLKPSLRNFMPNPSVLKDMDVAAERVAAAVIAGETIGIFGDYDVDGATSSALLTLFFEQLSVRSVTHIPDRAKEGYGPNLPALMGLKDKGASVIITVDCGTVAHEPLEAATAAGLDVIVVDHHQGEDVLPAICAVVNPNRLDETQDDLCQLAAVGVSFLLVVAVNRVLRERGFYETRPEPNLMQWLDIVALGTVCDVVPLKGLNRAFVVQGLKMMAKRGNVGLRSLMDVAGMDAPPAGYHAGFVLGPRINAGGRVGEAPLGTRLLTCHDALEADEMARQLDGFNKERQAIEQLVQDEALEQASTMHNHPMILVSAQGWHQGVIGIVAGRLKDRYHRPVAVLAIEGGVAKASARSVQGVDIGALVTAAKQAGLLLAGGGHAMAAGFSVEVEKLPALTEFFHEALGDAIANYQPELRVDGVIGLDALTHDFCHALDAAAPFGAGNPQPKFMLRNVLLGDVELVGKDHLRCWLSDGAFGGKVRSNKRIKAMAFRAADAVLGDALRQHVGKTVLLTGQPNLSFWQGRQYLNWHISDVAAA